MILERVESRGLAHNSYIIGHGREAAVIDPRRDCEIYLEKTAPEGVRITSILETHRNEDYLIGSPELAARTGAEIWHADSQWAYRYGRAVEEGQEWKIGSLLLKAIHAPGHTPGSMAYLLQDEHGDPWVLFSGDTLFAGDVGRVDLLGKDRMEELAGLLYDTIFQKLMPLGDGVLLGPAHGSGSVCGSAISERTWTSLGLERRQNPKLQAAGRADFIRLVSRELERPPYFLRMEELNLAGPPLLHALPVPPPLPADEFERKMKGATILDTRSELAFAAAHIPGALSIWREGLAAFAGWFLPDDRPILLVGEEEPPLEAVRLLARLGFDRVEGFLSGGMLSWQKKGKESRSYRTVSVQELCRIAEPPWVLDVRSEKEWEEEGRIAGAHHIHITQLPGNLSRIPRNLPIYIVCGQGLRSTIAAGILQREGLSEVAVVLGGMAAWNSLGAPVEGLLPAEKRNIP